MEEAGVGGRLPSFEITRLALLHFLVWPPRSPWVFWKVLSRLPVE